MKYACFMLFVGMAGVVLASASNAPAIMRAFVAIQAVILGFDGGRAYGKWEAR